MSERKPLLSDKERAAYYDGDGRDPFISIIEDVADVLATIRPARDGVREGFRRGVKLTDMYWRDLIDRGELMVVKTVTDKENGECSGCGFLFYIDDTGPRKFCPECGGKYKEP